MILLVSSASGSTGALTLISTNAAGVKADQGVGRISMTDAADKVAFSSSSSNLVTPSPSVQQAYVKDIASGAVTLVSTSSDGTPANSDAREPQISRNGRYVTFMSNATNLDPADTDALSDVYLKDLVTGQLTLVSTSASGEKGNRPSSGPAPVSNDGRTVVFSSNSTNLDPRHTSQTCTRSNGPGRPPIAFDCTDTEVYSKDPLSGALTLLTQGNHPDQSCPTCPIPPRGGPSGTFFAAVTADGSKVALGVFDPLTATDVDSDRPDVFVRDMTTGAVALASTQYPAGTNDSDGVGSYFPFMSSDGNRLVFQSEGAWNAGVIQVYVKDMSSGVITLVSRRQDGTPANDISQDIVVSGDGQFAGFSSNATNLDPADTDSIADVFLKDLSTGDLTLVSVTDGGTKGNSYSFFVLPADGGESVVFQTQSTNLLAADTDTYDDLYLKRFTNDANGDGIVDSLQPAGTPAGSFVDSSTSPVTSGSIVGANGLSVTIADAPDAADGVQFTVGPGSGKASFSVCGFTLRVSAGSTVIVTCGSIRVKTLPGSAGPAEVVLAGGLAVVTIPEGAVATVSDSGGGLFNVVNSGTVPVTVTVDGVSGTVGPGASSTLAGWHFVGFSQPVDNLPVMNKMKAGQALPIKWRLLNASNQPVTNLSSAQMTVTSLSCSAGATVDQIEETAAGASGLQNLGDGYYQLNWKSPTAYANSCKTLHLNIGDGVVHDANFQFTK
jgi:hypothetical protein